MTIEELDMHINFLRGAKGDELSYYLMMESDPNITYLHQLDPELPGSMAVLFGTGVIAYKEISSLKDYTLVQEVTHVFDLYYREPPMLTLKGGKYNIDLEEHGWDLQVEYMERNKIPINGPYWDYWYWKSKGNRERKLGVLENIPQYNK